MMVSLEVISAPGCNGMELMIGEHSPENPSGSPACAEKAVVGIIHPVHPEHCLETSFVEHAVVGDERQTCYYRFGPGPDFREYRGIFRVME